MSKLKTCPFCGGEAEIDKVESRYPNYFVRCFDCRAKIKWHAKKKDAVKEWNRRAE